ncbi:MAG: hypothetical protein Q7K45_04705, partial [Nanoarchaeota archaeon]|nr:hypothetical protein [Nanoarchaeota archaeon]
MEPQQIMWDASEKVLRNSQQELYVPSKRSAPLVVQCYGNPTTSKDSLAAEKNAIDRFKEMACKAEAEAYEIIAAPTRTCEWEFDLPDTYAAHAVGLLYGPYINKDRIAPWTRTAQKHDGMLPQIVFDPIQQRLCTREGIEYKGIRSSVYVGYNHFGHSPELERNILSQLTFEAQKQRA